MKKNSESYALSVRPPWAEQIVSGEKDIENRSWRMRYRGPIFIHESKSGGGRGAIIGKADLIDCVDNHPSPWFEGPYGFVLANPKRIKPISCKGRLKIFPLTCVNISDI